MNLESLANELLLNVFEYLNAVHILRAFYGLNTRLTNLLIEHFQTYSLDFRAVSKSDFDIVCQQHLLSIVDRIRSLCLSDDKDTPHQPDLFLSYGLSLRQFTNLQSLSLYHLRSTEIRNDLLLELRYLVHLTHLNIIECLFGKNPKRLIDRIWSLPKLIQFHLSMSSMNGSCVVKPTMISSSLTHVYIKSYPYNLTDLARLFESTPHLRHLSVRIKNCPDTQQLPSILPLMTTLKISINASFPVLTNVLRNMPNLRHLTIKIENIYINGYQWEEIIVNHLSNLNVFRLSMALHLDKNKNIAEQIDKLLDSFRTQFWLNKNQWFVRCDWDPRQTNDSIFLYTLPYPFKKFICLNNMISKSTCPDDRNYWSYDRVHTLTYKSSFPYLCFQPIRFSNIHHLKLLSPYNDDLWSTSSILDRLTLLELRLHSYCDDDDDDSYLIEIRDFFDRMPHLYSLTANYKLLLEFYRMKYTNTSIRQLDLQTYDKYFYSPQCVSLIQSLLGDRCEMLLINIKERTTVLDLINTMPNLRALTFKCTDDTWKSNRSLTTRDELLQWLRDRLLSTSSIIRDTNNNSSICLWIR